MWVLFAVGRDYFSMRRVLFVSAGIVAALSLTLASFTFFASRANAAPGGGASSFVHSCSKPQHGFAACHAIVNMSPAATAATPSGYGPSDLRSA